MVMQRMQRSLLVVDDEKLVRWTLEHMMEPDNYRIVSAENGKEAISILEHVHIDLIITDLVMPEVNGIDVAHRAKEIQPDVKVIMMTAHGSNLDKEKARKAGVSCFIEKPFQVHEVRAIVSRMLLVN